MFFFLQSWKEGTVRIFVHKSQYFWSQTSLIAPKESMMELNPGHRAVMAPFIYSLKMCSQTITWQTICRQHVPSIHRAKCVHQQRAYLNLPYSFIVNGGDITTSWSENRLLKEGKQLTKI